LGRAADQVGTEEKGAGARQGSGGIACRETAF
jgi:hypothetical protein